MPLLDVVRCVFLLFAQKLPSFNSFEEILRRRGGPFVEHRVMSADTLGYAYARMDPDGMREVLREVVERMRRNKSLRPRRKNLPWTVAVDGHEHFKSFHRSCAQCSTRTVHTAQGERTQYFHQSAVASLVNVQPPVSLDAELLRPGEGEVVAARRVVDRVIEAYPWVEVFTLDALYLEAPTLRGIVESGRSAIVPVKSEARELYQNVAALCAAAPARIEVVDGERLEVWDLRDLPGWKGMEGIPLRVVRTIRRYTKRERIGGKWVEKLVIQDWTWLVVGRLGQLLPVAAIHRLGHDRWDIEERGFNEQDRLYILDHCFCHDVTATVNLLLTRFLALPLTEVFFSRNVKDPLLHGISLAGLVRLLLEGAPPADAPCIWAQPCAP